MASKNDFSFKAMMQEILERFSHDELPEGSLREHWRIASSFAEGVELNSRLRRMNNRLLDLGTSTAIITRQLLVKTNAVGNSRLPGRERFHLCCQFEKGEEVFVFTHRTATLSDLLEYVANKLPQLAFGSGVRPQGQCLVLHTEDCNEWHLWDRRRSVSEVLTEFEVVSLRPMSTLEVVTNQSILAELLQRQHAAEEASNAAADSIASLPVNDPGSLALFRKDDRVCYAGEECTVVGVHLDTLPDVYYTIRMDDGRERQTLQDRIDLIRPSEPLAPELGGLHLRVDWAGVSFDVRGVDPAMSVKDLKTYIQRCAPRDKHMRITERTKLVCKGSTLLDKKPVSSTKIKGGSKIMLIG